MSNNIAEAITAKNEVIAQQGTSLDTVLTALEGKAAGSDISLGLTSATVGQTIKVKTVDASGRPTSWEAADMASGGGEKEWKLLQDVMITTDTASQTANVTYSIGDNGVYAFSFDKDVNGDYFSVENLFVFGIVKGTQNATFTLFRSDIYNNLDIISFRNSLNTTAQMYQFEVTKIDNKYICNGIFGTQYASELKVLPNNYISNNGAFAGDYTKLLNYFKNADPITMITLYAGSTTIGLEGRLLIYGR